MTIKNIFGETVEVTDYLVALWQTQNFVDLREGAGSIIKTSRGKNEVTIKEYYEHALQELLKIELPRPEWLFVGTYPTCYVYCDTRIESRGDYKEIARVFYNPVRLQVMAKQYDKYKEVIALAEQQTEKLRQKAMKGEPIQVSASGQTITPTI